MDPSAVNRDFTDLTERFESMAYFSLKIISTVKNYTRVTQNIPSLLLLYNSYRLPRPSQFKRLLSHYTSYMMFFSFSWKMMLASYVMKFWEYFYTILSANLRKKVELTNVYLRRM